MLTGKSNVNQATIGNHRGAWDRPTTSAQRGHRTEVDRSRRDSTEVNTDRRVHSGDRDWRNSSRHRATVGRERLQSGGREVVSDHRPQQQQQQRGQFQSQRGRDFTRGGGFGRGRGGYLGQHRIEALGEPPAGPRNPNISHRQGASSARPTISGPHLHQPDLYRPRPELFAGNRNITTDFPKRSSAATSSKSALGLYTAAEKAQIENRVGTWRAGTYSPAIQREGGPRAHNENWVHRRNNNNNKALIVPVSDTDIEMTDVVPVSSFTGGRGGAPRGRGRNENGYSGSGRGRGGIGAGSNRERLNGDYGNRDSGPGRGRGGSGSDYGNGGGRGRGRGVSDGGATRGAGRGAGRGGRDGRGRGGNTGVGSIRSAERYGHARSRENGGAEGQGPLFFDPDAAIDSEMESVQSIRDAEMRAITGMGPVTGMEVVRDDGNQSVQDVEMESVKDTGMEPLREDWSRFASNPARFPIMEPERQNRNQFPSNGDHVVRFLAMEAERDGNRFVSKEDHAARFPATEPERDDRNQSSKDDRAVRFSEGTTGHQKMAMLKAARERERADLIRRGIIDDPDNRKPLSEALTFVGTCMDMCPMFEREERQFQKSVDKLEIDPVTGLIDPKRAVKAFHRPAAGNESALPSDVRSPKVLVKTLDYLIRDIVGGYEDLMSTHGFVRDRTRGIRQDFTLQNYRGLETIECNERIARYHILCIHQLAQDDRFVLQQEMEQLQKTMMTLNELYDDSKKDGIPCPNEPELRAYQILIYIHDTECQRAAQQWGFADTDPGVQHALRLHQQAFNNAPRFFSLLRRRETTYLMGCIAEAHFYHIRKEHFRKMRQAYNKDTTLVTLEDIKRQLGFDHKSDLDRYLEHFGIETALDGQGEEYIVANRNFDDSRSQLRPTCNQKIVEAKRHGRKIPDVINGVAGQTIKGKARAEEEADVGRSKIQSWVSDEDQPSGMHGQLWQNSQVYANPTAAYKQSSQDFQKGRVPFVEDKANGFQPKQSSASNGFPPQNQKTPAFAPPQQQGGQQQPPSAFQQAMAALSKAPSPTTAQSSNTKSAFNPGAPVFQPTASAFQKVAPAFSKVTTGAFSQTAPAFSGGVSASASSLGSAFSAKAKFGPSSASSSSQPTASHQPTAELSQANKTAPIISAFPPPKEQLDYLNQGLGYNGSGDQSEGAWQQVGDSQQEGSYEEEGEDEGDDDDEYAMKQADLARRQGEVAQRQAQVDAQLEDAKRMLAEKEAAVLQKDDKKQSELRQSLLNHNFAQSVAQQQVQQPQNSEFELPPPQQQQTSVFNLPPQQQQMSLFDLPPQQSPATPFFGFPNPAENPVADLAANPAKQPDILNLTAFGLPNIAPSAFPQNFNPPLQPSPSLGLDSRVSFNIEKPAEFGQRSDAPSPEPNIPLAALPEPEQEPSPPMQDPAVLLEQFSQYVNTRMRYVIQAPNAIARRNVLEELKADLADALAFQPGLDECCNILATALYRATFSYAVFKYWQKQVRNVKMARNLDEKRRLQAEREKGLGTVEEQWVPVKIKIRPGGYLMKQGDLFRDANFQELPMEDIFANPIQKAFTSRGIVKTNFNVFCVNTDPKVEYWWLRKFGISSGYGLQSAGKTKKLANENSISVERVLREPEPPPDVGALIFGCRADWSMSNADRFEADKKDLYKAVEYALRNCRYDKIAIMVVCYRSPMDNKNADPYGEDVDRTEGEGRKIRLKAIRKALGMNALSKEKVITKEVILLETLQDLHLIPVMKRFAKLAAGVVDGDGLGRKEPVKRVMPIIEKSTELAAYEDAIASDWDEALRKMELQRRAKRKISVLSSVGAAPSANVLSNGISKAKKRASISPPLPSENGISKTKKRVPTPPLRPNENISAIRKPSPILIRNGIRLTKQSQLPTPGSEYFKLKAHGIHVLPDPIPARNTSKRHSTTSSFNSLPRGNSLPPPARSSTAAAFANIVSKSISSKSEQSEGARKRTRQSDSGNSITPLEDYRSASPPKRQASESSEQREERERREMENHQKRTATIRAALYNFDNDPVVVESRRIREAPEYHPELEWPEFATGVV